MNLKSIAAAGGGYPLAVAVVALFSIVLLPFRPLLPSLTIMMLFVPAIIGVARATGVRVSAAASVLAFLLLDFLFVPPYYHWSVASPFEWLGLVVFLIVALVSGQQTALLRQRERAAIRSRDELALLNRLSFRVVSEKSVATVAEFIVAQVVDVLGAKRAALYSATSPTQTPVRLAEAGAAEPAANELEFVRWVMRTSKAIGLPTSENVPLDLRVVSVGASDAIAGVVADGAYLPLQTAVGLEGVLFAEQPDSGAFAADDARLLAAVANLAAASLERQRLEGEAAHAEALREADRLKSTLMNSVSHELKTPLAAATARVTGLVEEGEGRTAARVSEELSAVADDLARLNDSIGDLLDLSRLESDAWQPVFEDHDLRDILGTVLSRLPAEQRDRVHFEIADDTPDVRADFAQLARAISNLIENALVYSPAGTEVEVGTRPLGDSVQLRVQDRGPGVPDAEKPLVFGKFYRGSASSSAPAGTGLGLAIAAEIVRTHDGTLGVEDAPGGGARFVLTIPAVREEMR